MAILGNASLIFAAKNRSTISGGADRALSNQRLGEALHWTASERTLAEESLRHYPERTDTNENPGSCHSGKNGHWQARSPRSSAFRAGRELQLNLADLSEALLCPACEGRLRFDSAGARCCCTLKGGSRIEESIVRYEPEFSHNKSEMSARDRQANGYLSHGKLPIQVYRIQSFVERASAEHDASPVLDLGCGPGPTTGILLNAGFRVVGIDFSINSLKLNGRYCGAHTKDALFVHGDLTRIKFARASARGLMMADFLQHLGDTETQRSFLERAFDALKPKGWFFLSFFNTNVKNWLKGDIEGSFSGGAIPYRRLSIEEVGKMLPRNVDIEGVLPMNIFNTVQLDRLVARLPFARMLARMIIIYGRKLCD
jgi:SAM-dependent methyltransferase